MPSKPKKPINVGPRAKPHRRADAELSEALAYPEDRPILEELFRVARAELRKREKAQLLAAGKPLSPEGTRRALHESEVYQIGLETQNAELTDARDRMELLVENYTDLYDFAPVGYFTLNERGQILEANLTGAAMLGVERSRLIRRSLAQFVTPKNRPDFRAFLAEVFAGNGKQACEAGLASPNAEIGWASLHGALSVSLNDSRRCCRVAVSDITSRKEAQEAQRRLEALSATNQKLQKEIVRKKAVEDALKQSQQGQRQLLAESKKLQAQLRHLSHQILRAQEDERKRISRELHDVIAQTLTGISVCLTALNRDAARNAEEFERNIAQTQSLVEHAVGIAHRFARELRPAVLDDLGLIPALRSYMKRFNAENGVHVHLTAFAGVEKLNTARRTVIFRVVQEALANVGKYAKAIRAKVTIQKLPDAVGLTIEDDGKGFHVERALRARKTNRLGLLGMRERVEMVNGSFTIESTPGKGTIISARIPFPKKRAARANNRLP